MKIAIVGAGSLGSLVGGLLARAHDVTLVGREPHVGAIQESGLAIESAIEAHVDPEATTEVAGTTADLAVVCVKAFDTESAARDLAAADVDTVCSLQNGLGNVDVLAERVDAPVLAGTATYGARLTAPGVVECTGVGEVVLGAREGGSSPVADRVGEAFRAAGIETTVSAEMPRRTWEKLAVNAGINATTALARVENGALIDGPVGEPAREAAREAARVARAEGHDLDPDGVADAVDEVAAATAANRSSMLQDVDAGGRTEVDAINGAVVDRAAAHGIAVPVNETLAALLRGWENGRTGSRN